MSILASKRHQSSNPTQPIVGSDSHRLQGVPDALISRIQLTLKNGSSGHAWFRSMPPGVAIGSVDLTVDWHISPPPGSFIEYEIRAEVGTIPTGPGKAILFEHDDFEGRQLPLSGARTTLVTEQFNDITSSIVVLSGTWIAYEDINLSKPFATPGGRVTLLTRGMYPRVTDLGISNDKISSLRPVVVPA